jgi:hypothetical protein
MAHVLTKAVRCRHEPKAARHQLPVCAPLVYSELIVAAHVFAEEKVAKQRVTQTKRLGWVFWNVKNSIRVLAC